MIDNLIGFLIEQLYLGDVCCMNCQVLPTTFLQVRYYSLIKMKYVFFIVLLDDALSVEVQITER